MKKLFTLSILIFCLTIISRSQITKHNWLLGGNAIFDKDKTTFPTGEESSTHVGINPKVGLFIIDHFAVGLSGNYSWTSTKSNNIKSFFDYFGIGPFIRYYFLPNQNRTNLLIESTIAYNEQGNSNISEREGFLSYGIAAGPVIFLNSSAGLEFLLGYNGYKVDKNYKNNGLSFSIGLQFHLEKD